MRIVRLRTPLIPVSVCAALMLAACGDDTTSSPADSSLAAPVVVSVASSGGTSQAAGSEEAPVAADDAGADGERDEGLLPAFGGYVFEVGEGLPPLPANSTGYHFPAGVTVDAAEVARIAAALGVAGEPAAADPETGNAWQVGPDDGSAPSLFVSSDGMLSWYYSSAWATTVVEGCASAGSDGEVDVPADDVDAAEVPVTTGDAAEVPVAAADVADAPADTVLPVEECVTPEPPVGVPTAEEAEAKARELLAALGEDPAAFQLDTYADEWSASVTAYTTVDGLRWPLAVGFGFGAEGVLQWANGALAEPVPTGPYPLIDLDTALARLGEQNGMWGYGGGAVAVDARAAEETAADMPVDGSAPPPDEGVTETPEPIVATLVDVEADFWWVWDTDDSVWLLPAYTFTDAEGVPFTVPAVTDDYMIVVEPVIEPVPEPVPAEPVDPVVVDPPATEPGSEPVPAQPPAPTGSPADLEALVGVPLTEFEELATRFGYTTRVARVDGVDRALTMDYSESRVNVAVEGDVVVEIVSIG